jgi:hypothetical protein
MFVSFSVVIEKQNILSFGDVDGPTWGLVLGFCTFVFLLITCGKSLYDSVISLRGDACAHKTSLTSSPFIAVPVPSYGNEWYCKYMLGCASISLIFRSVFFQLL